MNENTIAVTKKEAEVLDIVSTLIKQNRRVTIRTIADELQTDSRRICTILSRKEGLYKKFPALKLLIGRGPKIEYDISAIKKAIEEH